MQRFLRTIDNNQVRIAVTDNQPTDIKTTKKTSKDAAIRIIVINGIQLLLVAN
jgi:hypothetical protein